ncbi:MAG: B12-binding domain-containing radical SAM protein [Candidatus Diapherotrites archaeon]|uniref:B12-binding domain-containing radical SAM protein n=1 Tax=Candidatus Iainarchaeum sp. TaxID=3101447 RepID=A0A8T4KW40_9ARCH|nr:B12-binding domain-containing radical SAM protein [Candidatus Diapherotrites archaeon]
MAELVMVYPRTGYDIKNVSVDMPLASLSVASMVSEERETKIIDMRIDADWEKHLKQELQKEPVAVGISSMTGTQIKFGLDACRVVKDSNAHIPVVWGGIHATLLPQQTLQNELIDVVAIGEGEIVIAPLLNALEKNNEKKRLELLKKTNNIIFKQRKGKEERQVKTKSAGFADLDKLPALPYELIDIENYIHTKSMVGKGTEKALPFITSRGCPYRCTFCCNPRLSLRRWRCMSAERSYALVNEMVEQFDLDAVIFHDENFFANPARAEKIAELINNKFNFGIQARMDALGRVDLQKMERYGLSVVQPGIESGSERILQLIKKDESVSEILKVNKKLAKTSIVSVYNFMMGFPTETNQELVESTDLALKLIKENPNAELSGFYVFAPYPGTELFDFAVANGFSVPNTLEGWAIYSRQHLQTPWIQDKLDVIKNIMYTSKLVDGKRLEGMLSSLHMPRSLLKKFGSHYRKRWEKHDFSNKIDTKLMNFITRTYFGWE